MSRLSVTCLRHLAIDDFGRTVPAPMMPALKEMSLLINHEQNVSLPFPAMTTFILVRAGADCAIAIAESPIADPDYHNVGAGEVRHYGVKAGDRIAVIESI